MDYMGKIYHNFSPRKRSDSSIKIMILCNSLPSKSLTCRIRVQGLLKVATSTITLRVHATFSNEFTQAFLAWLKTRTIHTKYLLFALQMGY